MVAPSLDELELLMAGGSPPTLSEALGRMRPAWFHQAACRAAEGVTFFPTRGMDTIRAVAAARVVCASCPVQRDCLSYALAHEEAGGVWAGTTKAQRERMRRAMMEPKKMADGGAPSADDGAGRTCRPAARRRRR